MTCASPLHLHAYEFEECRVLSLFLTMPDYACGAAIPGSSSNMTLISTNIYDYTDRIEEVVGLQA